MQIKKITDVVGVYGASGLLGWDLYNFLDGFGVDVIGTYLQNRRNGLLRFDIRSKDYRVFESCSTVILAGGLTNIDVCESNPLSSGLINVTYVKGLIDWLKNNNKKIIYISSDRVFDGMDGYYCENDKCNPNTVYGKQKLEIEQYVLRVGNSIIFRLSKLYSKNSSTPNLHNETFNSLIKGKRIFAAFNQIFNPTDVRFVSNAIGVALRIDIGGVFHVAEKNVLSRFEFVKKIALDNNFDTGLIHRVDIRDIVGGRYKPVNSSLVTNKWCDVLDTTNLED